MKKFKYKLQNVLDIRRTQEIMKKAEIVRVKDLLASFELEIKNLEKRAYEVRGIFGVGRMQVEQVTLQQNFLHGVDLKIEDLNKNIVITQQKIEKLTAELRQRQREKDQLEKGFEKAREKWRNEMSKEEQLMFDELATLRFGRGI